MVDQALLNLSRTAMQAMHADTPYKTLTILVRTVPPIPGPQGMEFVGADQGPCMAGDGMG